MDWSWLFTILSDHLGEILLGLELYVLNRTRKKTKKEIDPAKVEKLKAKKLKKAQALMDEVDNLKTEEN